MKSPNSLQFYANIFIKLWKHLPHTVLHREALPMFTFERLPNSLVFSFYAQTHCDLTKDPIPRKERRKLGKQGYDRTNTKTGVTFQESNLYFEFHRCPESKWWKNEKKEKREREQTFPSPLRARGERNFEGTEKVTRISRLSVMLMEPNLKWNFIHILKSNNEISFRCSSHF